MITGFAALRVVALGVAVALLVAATLPVAGQTTELDRRLALFVRYLEPLRMQAIVPGLSAAIVRGGHIVWESGFGYADVDRRLAAAPDTPYRIASLTKTFASALLMQCVERGTLELDRSMLAYGAVVPDASATVRHVLSMTSDAAAGSRYRYDGDRYATLTTVADTCAGLPFRQALRTHILDRLAMTDSVPGQDLEAPSAAVAALFDEATLARYRSVIARLAKPYATTSGRAALADYPPHGISAAAGLISTVRDLAKYDRALDDHLLLRNDLQSLAWTPFALTGGQQSPYGLGWFTQTTGAGQAVWHFGLWPTFSSLILKLPERGATLILLANSDGLSARFPLATGDVTVSPFAAAFIAAVR
jgi:CubicO group peptidase (beta-lactamase class C family)